MSFKTFTCSLCGKTGLTKRTSYALSDGRRACRTHQEAVDAEAHRQERRDDNILEKAIRRLLTERTPNFLPSRMTDDFDHQCLMFLRNATSTGNKIILRNDLKRLREYLAHEDVRSNPNFYTTQALAELEACAEMSHAEKIVDRWILEEEQDAANADVDALIADVTKRITDWCMAPRNLRKKAYVRVKHTNKELSLLGARLSAGVSEAQQLQIYRLRGMRMLILDGKNRALADVRYNVRCLLATHKVE